MASFPENYSSNLPSGWEEKVSPEGRVFYVDHATKNTQWHHPLTGQRKTVVAGLPPGWEKVDLSNGRSKFYNKNKNITTDIDPRLPLILEEKNFENDKSANESSIVQHQLTYLNYNMGGSYSNPYLINPQMALSMAGPLAPPFPGPFTNPIGNLPFPFPQAQFPMSPALPSSFPGNPFPAVLEPEIMSLVEIQSPANFRPGPGPERGGSLAMPLDTDFRRLPSGSREPSGLDSGGRDLDFREPPKYGSNQNSEIRHGPPESRDRDSWGPPPRLDQDLRDPPPRYDSRERDMPLQDSNYDHRSRGRKRNRDFDERPLSPRDRLNRRSGSPARNSRDRYSRDRSPRSRPYDRGSPLDTDSRTLMYSPGPHGRNISQDGVLRGRNPEGYSPTRPEMRDFDGRFNPSGGQSHRNVRERSPLYNPTRINKLPRSRSPPDLSPRPSGFRDSRSPEYSRSSHSKWDDSYRREAEPRSRRYDDVASDSDYRRSRFHDDHRQYPREPDNGPEEMRYRKSMERLPYDDLRDEDRNRSPPRRDRWDSQSPEPRQQDGSQDDEFDYEGTRRSPSPSGSDYASQLSDDASQPSDDDEDDPDDPYGSSDEAPNEGGDEEKNQKKVNKGPGVPRTAPITSKAKLKAMRKMQDVKNVVVSKHETKAIYPTGYPGCASFSRGEAEDFKQFVIREIDRLDPNGSVHPRFVKANYRIGALLVTFCDTLTIFWLQDLIKNYRLPNGNTVEINTPKRCRNSAIVAGYFNNYFYKSEEEFLSELQSYNPKLNMKCWTVLQTLKVKEGLCISIGIPKTSLAAITVKKNTIFFRQANVSLRILSRRNSGRRPNRGSIRKFTEDIVVGEID